MRIGVFGGTFDPPHIGHLVVATEAAEELGLDRVLLVPAAVPPHKEDTVLAPGALRLEMVRAAVRNDPRLEVDDLEFRRDGPSYTRDTLQELRSRWPEADLFLLVGSDCVPELPGWRDPPGIARLARVVVLSREGEADPDSAPIRVEPLRVRRIDLSASEIRERVAAGKSIRHLVPDGVRRIIEREGLYQ